MHDKAPIARALAVAFVNASWQRAALIERAGQLLGKTHRRLDSLVDRLLATFPQPPRPRAVEISAFLLADAGFARIRWPMASTIDRRVLPPPVMDERLPAGAGIPSLCTVRQLADWLGVTISQLDWLADPKCLARTTEGKLAHYHFRLLAKRYGTIRLIESPKPRLKAIQLRLLREILDRVAPHQAAHGFRLQRSITTFVAPHVGQSVVVRVDLEDFFPSISRPRVAALFRAIGYPERVANVLASLCTSVTPSLVWENVEAGLPRAQLLAARSRYDVRHLPQGAPTSPALANLCAYRLDCRLNGLAQTVGAQYTRYADDLAFSGDSEFARRAKRFAVHVAATVGEEGFRVHHRKTRIMRAGVRQHLAGVVVNRRVNVRRSEYDQLKAILTNCRRHGPTSQNRLGHSDYRAHLRGRIAFVEQIHPERGQRLREAFQQIQW